MAKPNLVIAPRFMKVVSIDVAEVAAASVLEVTLASADGAKGLRKNGLTFVYSNDLEANLGIVGARCETNDELKFDVINPTAAPINPAAHDFYIVQF